MKKRNDAKWDQHQHWCSAADYVIVQHAFKMCILLEDETKKCKRQICPVKDLRISLTQMASLFKLMLRYSIEISWWHLFWTLCYNWTASPHHWGKVKMWLHMDIDSYLRILQYGSPEHDLLRNNTFYLFIVYLWKFLAFKKNAMISRDARFFFCPDRRQ